MTDDNISTENVLHIFARSYLLYYVTELIGP